MYPNYLNNFKVVLKLCEAYMVLKKSNKPVGQGLSPGKEYTFIGKDGKKQKVKLISLTNNTEIGADKKWLTTDDIKKIQAVIFSVYLTDTETCDGNVGPITKAKIKEFRTIHEITGDDDIEPDKKTVGPLTLAKISELIKAG